MVILPTCAPRSPQTSTTDSPPTVPPDHRWRRGLPPVGRVGARLRRGVAHGVGRLARAEHRVVAGARAPPGAGAVGLFEPSP
eukprot:scaffold58814_cov64-Phaeocystis_antarctica.AAC.2